MLSLAVAAAGSLRPEARTDAGVSDRGGPQSDAEHWRTENRWDPLDEEGFVAKPIDDTAGEVAELVAEAIHALPPLQREALILAEYEDLSLEEIACAVAAEVGAVKARLHRARENLRGMLAPLRDRNIRSLKTYGTSE
jgi:DNA-directed RNA polymerase specialized sigma24 family protein